MMLPRSRLLRSFSPRSPRFVFVLLYGPLVVPIVSSFFRLARGAVDWSSADALGLCRAGRERRHPRRPAQHARRRRLRRRAVGGPRHAARALLPSAAAPGRGFLQFIIFLPFLMPPIITGLSLLIFFREVELDALAADGRHRPHRLRAGPRLPHVADAPAVAEPQPGRGLATISAPAAGRPSARPPAQPVERHGRRRAILAFALSFDETMITLLVTGTQSTLPVRLWAMMRLGFTPDINALVALILAFTVLLCALAVRFLIPRHMATQRM